jgi:hypothetical protein
MLRIKFSKVAGNMGRGDGYGMNIAADDQHEELDGIIEDFVQGHAVTQRAFHNMTQCIPEIHQQMQQQYMMIQQLQQQLMY